MHYNQLTVIYCTGHSGINLQQKEVHISTDRIGQVFGDEITITAAAIGLNAVSYQWLKDDILLSTTNDPNCSGLDTPKLTISSFTRVYEGKYYCSVTFEDDEVVKSNYLDLNLSKYTIKFHAAWI